MFDIHPDLFRITFSDFLISMLGTSYELGGDDWEGIDCSGLIVFGLQYCKIMIDDRNTEELASDVFGLPVPPSYGPDMPLLVSYLGGEEPAWHCAYQLNARMCIHSTTGTLLGEGVVISKISDYYSILAELGYSTVVQWFDPSFLIYWNNLETE
jgi:cell wall-associated NlpC family hydrolase